MLCFSFGYGCREGYIKDLSGLEYATGLKTIDLSYTGVKDVSPIMKLNNLENLDINGMKMDDYSWLSNFTKMKRLNISRTKIQDFSFLNNMAELEELHVGSTSITDLDFLKNLKNYNKLELLDISDTAVSDLDVISRFVNIRSLYISGCNNIHNFKPLYNLTNLDYFSYWGVQISDNDILEIIRCSIKKKNYSKGDLINIPLSYSILHGDGNLHIDVNGRKCAS